MSAPPTLESGIANAVRAALYEPLEALFQRLRKDRQLGDELLQYATEAAEADARAKAATEARDEAVARATREEQARAKLEAKHAADLQKMQKQIDDLCREQASAAEAAKKAAAESETRVIGAVKAMLAAIKFPAAVQQAVPMPFKTVEWDHLPTWDGDRIEKIVSTTKAIH